MTATYPDEFYVAHVLFTGPNFPREGVWGDILDGPETAFDIVLDAVAQRDKSPTRKTLRVGFVKADGTYQDVTNAVIVALEDAADEVED